MKCKIKAASKKWDDTVDNFFTQMGKKLSMWDKRGLFVASETQNLLHNLNADFFAAKNALLEQARTIKDNLAILSKEDSKLLVRAMNGDIKADALSGQIKKVYDVFRAEIDKNAQALVDSGMLEPGHKIEDYVKRYYQQYIEQMSFASKIIFSEKYKQRKDLSLDQRVAIGLIEDASFVIPNTILEQKMQILRAKQLEKIELLFGEDIAKDGYVFVPIDKMGGGVLRYGALSGKYIPKDIFDALNETTNAARTIGVLERNWYPLIDHIKQNLTIKNPFTHLFNIGSNIILASLKGDLGAVGRVLMMSKAQREKLIKQANALGLNSYLNDINMDSLRPELKFKNNTLQFILNMWQNAYMSKGSKTGDVVRNMYEWEDKIFKLGAFYKNIEDFKAEFKKEPNEKELRELFNDANSAYVDYAKPIGAIPKFLDKSGLFPFLHYQIKSTPEVAKIIAKNPIRYALYLSAMAAVSGLNFQDDGHDNDKPFWADDKFNLFFAKEYVSLGNNWYFNLGRLMPAFKFGGINFAQPNEHGEMELSGGILGGMLRIAQGEDPLGRKIGSKYDNIGELLLARVAAAMKSYAPPVTMGRYALGAADIALSDSKNAPKNSYKEAMTIGELALRAAGIRNFDGKKEENTKARAMINRYKNDIKNGMSESEARAKFIEAEQDSGVSAELPSKKEHFPKNINIAPRLKLD